MNIVDKLKLLISYSVGKDLRSTSHLPCRGRGLNDPRLH